jgi:hypothetical protein
MFIYRSINLLDPEHKAVKSTLALEPVFWEAIDDVFGRNWRHWAIEELQNKPEEQSNSSWIRQAIMKIQRADKPLRIHQRTHYDLARLTPVIDITIKEE